MGFDALLADYYWLQAIQVAGANSTIGADTASHLGKLIDVVTTVNPHVDHPYRFAAVWMTHSYEQVQTANRLLSRSIEYHPEDWRNHFYQGFNHFYYLGDFEAAADALEIAISLPGSPSYLPRLVARLKSERGDIGVAEVFLRELLTSTTDEAEIAKLESGLDEIEIEYKARHLDRARDAYKELTGHDIRWAGDLIRGQHRVLEKLPSPEPDSMPESLRRGSIWEVGDDGRIVSSYLGKRYEVHFSGYDAPYEPSTASVRNSDAGEDEAPEASATTGESSFDEGDRHDG
jgi:tetratricopeptide (TPR) repeat protein